MELIRRVELNRRRLLRRGLAAALGIATFSLTGVACSSSHPSSPKTPGSTSATTKPVTLTPDLSGFLKNPTTCLNGGPRPCAIVLRAAPELAAKDVNTLPTATHVSWPLESYNGQPGDAVTIDCYESGQELRTTRLQASSIWYKVGVPVANVLNPEIRPTDPNQQTVPGYASVLWFGQLAADSRVPAC